MTVHGVVPAAAMVLAFPAGVVLVAVIVLYSAGGIYHPCRGTNAVHAEEG